MLPDRPANAIPPPIPDLADPRLHFGGVGLERLVSHRVHEYLTLMYRAPLAVTALCLAAVTGCDRGASRTTTTATADSAWMRLSVDSLPNDSMGVSIRRGRAILAATHDSMPAYAPSALKCTSCHLDNGRKLGAVPLYGSYARYPQYLERAGGVVSIADRVNFCFTRSLSGYRVPDESSEMRDIVAYLAFLSRGIPAGADPAGTRIAAMPAGDGDSTRGVEVYAANCARCHGGDARGTPIAPPLWGDKSFSIGASMARLERAAAFIRHNMPLDRPGALTDQQAYDVAAYVTSLPRMDLPGKELDYPGGKAPKDTPYRTRSGHVPARVVSVIPRPKPADALVPLPVTARKD
jgi:thiosulfate dehydrogenase